jgi:hypothetical protein
MIDFNKLIKLDNVEKGFELIAQDFKRRGVDAPLASSIAEDIINYNQFKSFQFGGDEVKELLRGSKSVQMAFTQRVPMYADNIEKDLRNLTTLSPDEISRIKDIFYYSFQGFIESAQFHKEVEEGFEKLKDNFRNLMGDHEEE